MAGQRYGMGDAVDYVDSAAKAKLGKDMVNRDIEFVLTQFLNFVADALVTGLPVTFNNFGSFSPKTLKARTGQNRNPATGEALPGTWRKPERLSVSFDPSPALIDYLTDNSQE